MSWRPSDEIFSLRVEALIERDGVQALADRYDVTPQTIRRWGDGGQARNPDVRRSIVRRGIGETGAVIQQTGTGRFSTSRAVYDASALRGARTIQQNRRAAQEASIRLARNERQRAMAESMSTDVTYAEIADMERNLNRLTEAEEAAEAGGWEHQSEDWYAWWEENYPEYDDGYDWDMFRSFYEQMAG